MSVDCMPPRNGHAGSDRSNFRKIRREFVSNMKKRPGTVRTALSKLAARLPPNAVMKRAAGRSGRYAIPFADGVLADRRLVPLAKWRIATYVAGAGQCRRRSG